MVLVLNPLPSGNTNVLSVPKVEKHTKISEKKIKKQKQTYEKQGFAASLLYLLLELSEGYKKLSEQAYVPGSIQRHC